MWQFIRDFHYYRPGEKRAIILLMALVLLTIGTTAVVEHYQISRMANVRSNYGNVILAFSDSLRGRDSLAASHRRYIRQTSVANEGQHTTSKHNHSSRRQRVKTERMVQDSQPSLLLDTLPRFEKIEKYQPGTLVDLNKADTTELKKIPGIGSVIARMIVNYRNELGGFYQVGQLCEINLDANQLTRWFYIDEADIRKIPVNKSSVDRLRHHPYINFYQAKAMVEHRRKHGNLQSLKPLVLYEEFKESDLERIGHYLDFN